MISDVYELYGRRNKSFDNIASEIMRGFVIWWQSIILELLINGWAWSIVNARTISKRIPLPTMPPFLMNFQTSFVFYQIDKV